MRGRLALPVLLAASLPGAACGGGDPVAGPAPRVEVRGPSAPVVSGTAFPVTVVRTWKAGDSPSVASERDLAPLAARLDSASRRDDGRLVEETLRYTAHAFSLKDVGVRPVPLAVRAQDGAIERATSAPLRIAVRPEVDPESPGAPELPEPEGPESRSPWPWIAGVATAAAALLLARRRRRAATPPAAPATGAGPDRSALEALGALGRADPAEAVPAAADVLRAWLASRFEVPVLRRTTPETLALPAVEALPTPARAALSEVLRAGDAVKFAGRVPTTAERDAVLTAAEDVVRAAPERAS